MRGFLADIKKKKACYECKNRGFNRVSDITLADYWGIDDAIPEMFDNQGTSAVFVNTLKGEKIFNKISEQFSNIILHIFIMLTCIETIINLWKSWIIVRM